MRKALSSLLLLGLLVPFAQAEQKLSPSEAKQHIGEHAIVCGLVASTRYAQRSRGQPTFLNLDKPYPNQIFTVLIWGDDRAKFGPLNSKYMNKKICVSGDVKEYKGEPEIIATDPSQIKEQ